MALTIAIVSHNEEKEMDETLSRLLSEINQHPDKTVSLLLIDNGSTDLTYKKLEIWLARQSFKNISLVQRSENHMAKARTQALELCKSSYLLFLDMGSYVDKGWLKGVFNTINNWPDRAAAVGGPSPYIVENEWQNFAKDLLRLFPWGDTRSEIQEVDHFPTNNLLLKVDCAKEVGLFDSLFGQVGEDLDFSARLTEKYKIYFSPNFIIRHKLPHSFFDWLKKMAFYGRAQSMVFLKNKGRVDRKKFIPILLTAFFSYGLIQYPFVFQVIFVVSMIIPRLRFLLLSFLFYGFGEFVGLFVYYFKTLSSQSKSAKAIEFSEKT